MHILAVLLLLINVGAVAGPVAGVAIVYQSNPMEMIVPPQVEQVISQAIETNNPIEMPQYLSSTYDLATKTVTATFTFTNPFQMDLKIKSLSADVECTTHAFALGYATLPEAVRIDKGATATITVVFVWTQAAEEHFLTAHKDASNIDIRLTNLGVDISGIKIETPETIVVNVPLT